MWEKQVPNEPGYWLRVNAGHQVQLHQVFRIEGKLKIFWGWCENKRMCNVVDIADRLKCFYWRGVIPEPPAQALKMVRDMGIKEIQDRTTAERNEMIIAQLRERIRGIEKLLREIKKEPLAAMKIEQFLKGE